MRVWRKLLIFLFAFISLLACGKKAIVWQRIIDSGEDETPVALFSFGENLILVANQGKPDSGRCLGVVQILDHEGRFLRRQTFSEGKMNNLQDAHLDSLGNIFLCGSTRPYDTTVAMVVKTSIGGRTYWKKGLALGQGSWANGICLTDTNIAICGGVQVSKGREVFVAVLNPTGRTLWSRTYQQGEWAEGFKIAKAPNGNLVILGKKRSGENEDILLFCLKLNGDTVWSRVYDSKGKDAPGDLIVDQFGNIIAVGTAYLKDSLRCIILEYTSDGSVVRKVAYGENAQAEGKGLWINDKGEIFICGGLRSPKRQGILLFEYAPNALSVWERQHYIGKEAIGTAVVFDRDIFVAAEVANKTKDVALLRFAWLK